MHSTRTAAASSRSPTWFILYVAVVLTAAMVLFPPFTSINGTEYAFVGTGPEWSHRMGLAGADLRLTPRIHRAALAVQLAALWAIAAGASWFLGRNPDTLS